MNAKKCDRCGDFYLPEDQCDAYSIWDITSDC